MPPTERKASYTLAVTEWLQKRGIGNVRNIYPVSPESGSSGFLEIVSPSNISPKQRLFFNRPQQDQNASKLIEQLAKAIAIRITRHRNGRRLKGLKELLTKYEEQSGLQRSPDPVQLWYEVAAEVVGELTSAEIVLVLKQNSDLTLRVTAGFPEIAPEKRNSLTAGMNSLVRTVFDKTGPTSPYRILDHRDVSERISVFGTDKCDEVLTEEIETILRKPLRSWIASAVTYADSTESAAVILVANKRPQYLPAVFSHTDNILLHDVCGVLSRSLVQAQTSSAIRALTEFVFTHSIHDDSDRQKLLSLLSNQVPGIVAGAVTLHFAGDSGAPEKMWPLGFINGHEQCYTHLQSLLKGSTGTSTATTKPDTQLTPFPNDSSYFSFTSRLPFVGASRIGTLHLACRRARLAPFELEILHYLAADLGQFIRTEQMINQQIEDLVQIRHAIRSGIQGMGHLDNAWEIYTAIAKHGIQPEDLQLRMLRKSLEWCRLFVARTRLLVEESRFLLNDVTADSLRLGGHPISRIVRDTIICLRPDAESRGIELGVTRLPLRGE